MNFLLQNRCRIYGEKLSTTGQLDISLKIFKICNFSYSIIPHPCHVTLALNLLRKICRAVFITKIKEMRFTLISPHVPDRDFVLKMCSQA